MNYVRCKVVMLPTEKESTIIKCIKDYQSPVGVKVGDLLNQQVNGLNTEFFEAQYIYVLSDENVKVNDWVYNQISKQIYQFKENNVYYEKKIIATTDESLKIPVEIGKECSAFHSDDYQYAHECGGCGGDWTKCLTSLPRPSNTFLKKYCEVGGIDEVMVEFIEAELRNDNEFAGYINIAKVASDNTITIKPVDDDMELSKIPAFEYTCDLFRAVAFLNTAADHRGRYDVYIVTTDVPYCIGRELPKNMIAKVIKDAESSPEIRKMIENDLMNEGVSVLDINLQQGLALDKHKKPIASYDTYNNVLVVNKPHILPQELKVVKELLLKGEYLKKGYEVKQTDSFSISYW